MSETIKPGELTKALLQGWHKKDMRAICEAAKDNSPITPDNLIAAGFVQGERDELVYSFDVFRDIWRLVYEPQRYPMLRFSLNNDGNTSQLPEVVTMCQLRCLLIGLGAK
jgi:hypothetical protein